LSRLEKESDGTPVSLNGIAMPHLALMAILEVVLPGNSFITIKNVDQLEARTNIHVATEARADMQKVLDTYPVRLSMHTIRQMRISRNVAYQYLPFTEELDTVGHTNTWIGQFHQGLLEQMYANRVIFLLNMSCPVYCRFCFRKHKESRNQSNPTPADVQNAVAHVHRSPAVKEIVVTGGDPFMNRSNMTVAVDSLAEVAHVRALRLATRSIAYYPHMFFERDGAYLNWLKEKNLALQQRGKRMEVATHFIHPDEVSPQSLSIIGDLVRNGIAVYIQTPFLKDCNDQGPELVRLFSLMRGAGAEMHYIYIPCSPIHGNSVYWSPISSGIKVASHLRAHLSDRAIPRICTATPIGKMDWHSSGWAVGPVEADDRFIWIRTPYTPDYFKRFAPLAEGLDNIRVNAEGTIDIQYFAQIGDERLFLGDFPSLPDEKRCVPETVPTVAELLTTDRCLTDSIVATHTPRLFRQHETRVELNISEATPGMFDYISKDPRITDVVLAADHDIVMAIDRVTGLIKSLAEIPHINSVRLRSLMFNSAPERYSPAVIDRLAGLGRLSIVGPLRVEIESRFYLADEITDTHHRVVRALNNRGITVYCNTPLITGLNDNPDAIQALSFQLRQAGIEFHHLYVAGLPHQVTHNRSNPVRLCDVIAIATRVRREGSGREIPRYVIRTMLGEVDFGLTSRFALENGSVQVGLLPYRFSYYQAMDRDFEWPSGVDVDAGGVPIVKVPGISATGRFALG
jgi:lysine 2,3-aminomutase